MEKVLVAGYYGFGNAGDELILRSISTTLRKQNPSCEIIVLSNHPEKTASEHGVKAINRWSPAAVLKAILQCDLFIFGGGGLLQDTTGSPGLWYYLLLLWISIFLKKKLVVYAIGIGPIQRWWNRFLIAKTLNFVDRITVRDRGSLLELKRLSVEKDIEVVPDPVLSLTLPLRTKDISQSRSCFRVAVVIRSGVTDLSANSKDAFVEMFASVSEKLVKRVPVKIVIFPFHPVRDETVARALLVKLNGNAELFQWQSLDELIGYFSQMDLVVSMRLHAIILSVLMKIPVVGIAIDPKINNFVGEFFKDASAIPLLNMEECNSDKLLSTILNLWENRREFAKVTECRVQMLQTELRSCKVLDLN